jgi:hypothetical protein
VSSTLLPWEVSVVSATLETPAVPGADPPAPLPAGEAFRRGGWGRLAAPAGRARFRRMAVFSVKLGLLLAVLALYFVSRQYTARAMPLEWRHFYPYCYGVSLSLMAGHGFNLCNLPDMPEMVPVKEFLELKRPRLRAEQFARFAEVAEPPTIPSGDELARAYNLHASTRVLDVHVTVLLWKVFGIRWKVLFTFYALVGTASCLGIFLIARQLGGYAAGLLAAALFVISPLDNYLNSWSIRDASPLWFTVFSFVVYVCLVGRFRSWALDLAAVLLLGFVSVLGYGYRFDALLLPPFFLAATVVLLRARGRSWGHTLAAAGVFLAGGGLSYGSIKALGPPTTLATGTGFHIALYGDDGRSELLGRENSLQAWRSDEHTSLMAQDYHQRTRPDAAPLVFLSPEYAATCKEMYGLMAGYHAYDWASGFPSFYFRALQGLQTYPGFVQGIDAGSRQEFQAPWLLALYERGLAGLIQLWPYLFLLGSAFTLLLSPEPVRAGSLVVFSAYYAASLLLVLPEVKHLPPMLVPLTVIGGIEAVRALGLCVSSPTSHRLKWVGGLAAVGVLVWLAATGVSYCCATSVRAGYIREVKALAEQGTNRPEAIKDPKTFTVQFDLREASTRKGYLLKIEAGEPPGVLTCTHDRRVTYHYVTRHELWPGRTQFFFVSCLPAPHHYRYTCVAQLSGDAAIVSCTEVDLSAWQRLPFSTVFHEGQRCPGSPPVRPKQPAGPS